MHILKHFSVFLISLLFISAFAGDNINNIKNNNKNDKSSENTIINQNNNINVFQLVKPDPTHTNIEVVPEGLDRLNSISQKVVVISALGEYKSGKSFLLNQLMKEQQGFAIGPTVAPETKGIWARVSYVEDIAIVFLDTEGFFGNGAAETYDAKIFAVSTLLSSKLLFNSVKTIDQASLDYLERALMFSLKASVKEHYGSSYLSFPSLTWVVRDFISEIPVEYGGGSPSAWINHLLSIRKRESVNLSGDEEERMTNQELSKIFSSVDCQPLPFPLASLHLDKLQHLDQVPSTELNPKFMDGVSELRTKIYSNLEKKKFHNQELNGFGLAELLKTLVELANTGIFPKVPGVWEGFIRVESQTALGDCAEAFRKEVQSNVNSSLPLPERNLQIIFDKEEEEALIVLRAMLLGLTEIQSKVAAQLKTELSKLRERFEEVNSRNIQLFCSAAREDKEIEMDSKVAEFNLPISPSSLKKQLQTIASDVTSSYKQRVSAYSVSPHCIPSAATLLKHIEKVQSNVDAANLVALRKACADAKSTSSQKFSLSLSSLTLPLSPSLVKKECEKGMEAALKDFDEKTKEFRNTEAQTEIRKELEHVLALKKENTILANNNQIEEKILALGKQIVAAKTKKYDYQLKTAAQMNELKSQLVKEATAQFEESATYALESNSFPAWKLQFTTDIKAAGERLAEANKELVSQFFANETESHLKTLRSRMRSVKAKIPLEEREIESQIESHTGQVRSDWEARTNNYVLANPEAYKLAQLEFNNEARETAAILRRENVNELLRLSKAALERGERRMEDLYRGAWFQYLFTRQVTSILQEELGETIKSEKLRNEAIQAYIEDNLDKKFPFSPILSFVQIFVGIATVVISVLLGTACLNPRTRRPTYIK